MKMSRNALPLFKGELEGVKALTTRHPTPPTLPLKRGGVDGFSLIESLVIISIISILASLSLVALPAARAHQQLVADTELIQSLLLDSKERALNQVRPEECITQLGVEQDDKILGPFCSDVGIDFNKAGEVTQFADLNESGQYEKTDYKIVTHSISSTISTDDFKALIFKSAPPSVELYKNKIVLGPSDTAKITLTAANGETRTLEVHQFGTLDIVENKL